MVLGVEREEAAGPNDDMVDVAPTISYGNRVQASPL